MPRPNSRATIWRPGFTGPIFQTERRAAALEQRVEWLESEVEGLIKLCRNLAMRAEAASLGIEDLETDVGRVRRLVVPR